MKVAKSWKEMTNLKKIHADILRFNEVNEHRELVRINRLHCNIGLTKS